MKKELVDQWLGLDAEIKKLEAERTEIANRLLKDAATGDELTGASGGKVKVQQNSNLQSDQLKALVSTSLFNAVSLRKVDATLVKAALKVGKLDASVVNSCRTPGKQYLKKM